jgi:hypothetical protein
MTHDRFGSSSYVQQKCLLSQHNHLDETLRVAVKRTINSYRQQYADNQNICFLPAMMILLLLFLQKQSCQHKHTHAQRVFASSFLQAHQETETHLTAAGMS